VVQTYSWFSIYFNYFYLEIASRYIIFMLYKFLFDLAYMYVASFCRLLLAGTNLRTEPKHIVFLSQLLLLFQFCHVCKAENPELVAKQVGTEAVITTNCFNPKCPKKVNTWHSQPAMPNSQIPAGNFLLFMAVLLAGGSVTKVFQIFKHMGLCCVSLKTFFKYQQVSSGNLYIHRSSTEGS